MVKFSEIKIRTDYYILDSTNHTRRARAEELKFPDGKSKAGIVFFIHSLGIYEKIGARNVIREAD